MSARYFWNNFTAEWEGLIQSDFKVKTGGKETRHVQFISVGNIENIRNALQKQFFGLDVKLSMRDNTWLTTKADFLFRAGIYCCFKKDSKVQ